MPTATGRRSANKIYKRVSANLTVDTKYPIVLAELEGQGLDQRKRTRIRGHIVPYGSAEFEDKIRPEITGEQELAEARGMSCIQWMRPDKHAAAHLGSCIPLTNKKNVRRPS